MAFCCGEVYDSFIAVGTDSFVYKRGDSVIKVYNGERFKSLPPDELKRKIELYAFVMSQASWQADGKGWRVDLPSSRVSIPVKIVPVSEIIECSYCHTPASVSRFIGGSNLEEVSRARLPFDLTELRRTLPVFSLAVGERLGVYGISVVPVNIKYKEDRFIITDLCTDLLILGKRRC